MPKKLKETALPTGLEEYLRIKVVKNQARYKRIKDPKGPDHGIGNFLLEVNITATKADVYIPVSIASGKKATGFIYQIEGTATGSIGTAKVSAKGEGLTEITLGTIRYAKIPIGKTATFRMQIEIKGKVGQSYQVVINWVNYKLHPNDARYRKSVKGFSSKLLRFK